MQVSLKVSCLLCCHEGAAPQPVLEWKILKKIMKTMRTFRILHQLKYSNAVDFNDFYIHGVMDFNDNESGMNPGQDCRCG